MTYRRVQPNDESDLPLRMLYVPIGDQVFERAVDADDARSLVAALLDDPHYPERPTAKERLVLRLQAAQGVVAFFGAAGRAVTVGDHPATDGVNIANDSAFIDSLQELGYVAVRHVDGTLFTASEASS